MSAHLDSHGLPLGHFRFGEPVAQRSVSSPPHPFRPRRKTVAHICVRLAPWGRLYSLGHTSPCAVPPVFPLTGVTKARAISAEEVALHQVQRRDPPATRSSRADEVGAFTTETACDANDGDSIRYIFQSLPSIEIRYERVSRSPSTTRRIEPSSARHTSISMTSAVPVEGNPFDAAGSRRSRGSFPQFRGGRYAVVLIRIDP